MVITRIVIELGPSSKEETLSGTFTNRTLTYTRESRKWTSGDTEGFHPGEIKLIAAIDDVRAKNQL